MTALPSVKRDSVSTVNGPNMEGVRCLTVALAIIIIIGSAVATGCLHSQWGNSSFAIAGSGLAIGLILLSVQACCRIQNINISHSHAPVEKEIYEFTDREWLEPIHLNFYITYLAAIKFPDQMAFIEHGNAYTIENLEESLFNYLLPEIVVKSGKSLPIYIHLCKNHWALVYIDQKTKTIEYYDSKRDWGNVSQIDLILKNIASRLSSYFNEEYSFQRKITKILQPDNFECAIWILLFLEYRLKNPNIDFNNLVVDIGAHRKKVRERLKEMAQLKKAAEEKELKAYLLKYPEIEDAVVKRDQDYNHLCYLDWWQLVYRNEYLKPDMSTTP